MLLLALRVPRELSGRASSEVRCVRRMVRMGISPGWLRWNGLAQRYGVGMRNVDRGIGLQPVAVDVGAIGRAEILKDEAIAEQQEPAVLGGNRRLGDHDATCVIAANNPGCRGRGVGIGHDNLSA